MGRQQLKQPDGDQFWPAFSLKKKKKVLAGLATTKKQEQNGSLSATCCFHAERFPVAKRNSYLKNAVHLAPYLLELD